MRRLLLIICVLALLLASIAPAFAQYGQTIHIVERGETLASIAQMYGVTVQAIASANGIWNPNFIWAGERLIIPAGGGYPPPQPPPQHQNYYIVRWGDTLSSIALQFGVSPWAIAQANHIYNLNQIFAGMYLTIPGGSYHPPHPGSNTYVVRWGDTLATIAWQFGTTAWAIASYNGLTDPNFIWAGEVLYIPSGSYGGY